MESDAANQDPMPIVSVLVITYNHEELIEQALESVLMQQTDFPIELIISEDASTDRTADIVRSYQDRYPDLMRVLTSPHNLRSNGVVSRGLRAARGRYVALLDGDDYWLEPHKLQKQADYLDRHSDLSMCFANARVVDKNGASSGLWTSPRQTSQLTLQDIWQGNPAATCTAMLRRSAVSDIGAWYDSYFPVTDWPLYIYAAERGPIGYQDEVLGAYRLHEGGLYSRLSEDSKLEFTDAFYRRMNKDRAYKYDVLARTAHSTFFFDWAQEYLRRGDFDRARRCLGRSLRAGGLHRAKGWHTAVKLALTLCLRLGRPAETGRRVR